MSYLPALDLKSFIATLRKESELVEITLPVSPKLEIPEIHRRVISSGGPALLFKNAAGSKFPVVTNLFGTKKRVELAFGTRALELMQRYAKFPEKLFPPTLGKLWQEKDALLPLLKLGTKNSSHNLIKASSPKLTELPLLTLWPKDGGAFVTLPLVYTEHPKTKIPNLGMYRLQRYSDTETGLHCQIGKGGGFHLHEAWKNNAALPVNVFLGGPPALIIGAIAPLPENVPEIVFSSFLLGGKLPTSTVSETALPIINSAEFVLIGDSPPNQYKPEGPFGDHYGYYSLTHDYPVFQCKAIYHKPDAIYPATVVGKPRQEDFFIGNYLQELLSPIFPIVMPTVSDLWSYGETGYHALAAAVVKERYPREALVSAFRILGEGQLSLTKFLICVDKPQDLKNFKGVLTHLLERFHPSRDLILIPNTAMDTLDYTGREVNKGSKGILIGVGDKIRDLPNALPANLPNFIKKVKIFSPGCLVVEAMPYQEENNLEALSKKLEHLKTWPLIILTDDVEFTTSSDANFLWSVFLKFEPASDMVGCNQVLRGNSISREFPIIIDARKKPWFPDEVEVDDETKKLVDEKWCKYFDRNFLLGSYNPILISTSFNAVAEIRKDRLR